MRVSMTVKNYNNCTFSFQTKVNIDTTASPSGNMRNHHFLYFCISLVCMSIFTALLADLLLLSYLVPWKNKTWTMVVVNCRKPESMEIVWSSRPGWIESGVCSSLCYSHRPSIADCAFRTPTSPTTLCRPWPSTVEVPSTAVSPEPVMSCPPSQMAPSFDASVEVGTGPPSQSLYTHSMEVKNQLTQSSRNPLYDFLLSN